MRNKINLLPLFILLVFCLSGCQKKHTENQESKGIEKMNLPVPSTGKKEIKAEVKAIYTPVENSGMPTVEGLELKTHGDLNYYLLKTGSGDLIKKGQRISTHYTGWFENGKVFDSSRTRNSPFDFTVGQGVIGGWSLIAQQMRVGDQVLVIIPPHLGYGSQDYGPIKGNSTLIFEMEILGVK